MQGKLLKKKSFAEELFYDLILLLDGQTTGQEQQNEVDIQCMIRGIQSLRRATTVEERLEV